MINIHELKCWHEYFQETIAERKTAEYRKNDRDFQPNEFILLREFIPEEDTDMLLKVAEHYTGYIALLRITHVLVDASNIGLPDGYCTLSVQLLWHGEGR